MTPDDINTLMDIAAYKLEIYCEKHHTYWLADSRECDKCLWDELAERNARDGYCGKGEYT